MALDYKDLAIAKPLDGQMITEAEGTITIEKTNAVIKAKAKLNGVPAEIDAVEPLGQGDMERKRLITVVLDEKARKLVVPGLDGLLEGSVKVTVDAKGGGKQLVKADLTDAQLNIPWVGWIEGHGHRRRRQFHARERRWQIDPVGFRPERRDVRRYPVR